ncbi:Hypothetical_protein [Hexamita inflata]|uniref:Hypothetical_protein n=1 Tax=Hexamita inflata TaxID=28002 RepID=A0AA86V0L9_9EUKA|nr:Hypothetical protein HINF_LOCUS63509 [Hexamita inflata]
MSCQFGQPMNYYACATACGNVMCDYLYDNYYCCPTDLSGVSEATVRLITIIIVSISVGCALLLIISIIGCYFCCCRKRNQQSIIVYGQQMFQQTGVPMQQQYQPMSLANQPTLPLMPEQQFGQQTVNQVPIQ